MKVYKLISTFFGIGYLPWFPGTWASLFTVVVCFFIGNALLAGSLVVLCFLGIWASELHAKDVKRGDPSEVVIDEVVGMGISLLFLPKTIIFMVAAFFLFRLLDIWKPSLIGKAEKLPGGWGIMLDDVLAGILANIVLQCGHLGYLAFVTTN